MIERRFAAPGVDFATTTRLVAFGRGDPTAQRTDAAIVKAFRTKEGAVTLEITALAAGEMLARAWGPGAERALAAADAIVGGRDDPSGFKPLHALIRDRHARRSGARLGRVPWISDAMLHVILQQRVNFRDAAKGFRLLVGVYGEPAPGPYALKLPPPSTLLSRLPFDAFRQAGIDRQRADTMRRAALVAHHLDALFEKTNAEARALLTHVRGIGPWSTEMLMGFVLGDTDAVPVGDLHLPHIVTWALAGEAPGTDERMLELLEPYRPHRFRVARMLLIDPPK